VSSAHARRVNIYYLVQRGGNNNVGLSLDDALKSGDLNRMYVSLRRNLFTNRISVHRSGYTT